MLHRHTGQTFTQTPGSGSGKIKGDLTVTGNAEIGNAYIGKHHLTSNEFIVKRNKWLKKKLETKKNVKDIQSVRTLTEILYEKAYNSIDIIKILENNSFKKENKFLFLIYFDKIRSQFRDEKLLMLTILNLFFLRKNLNLENILEM